MLIPYGNYTMLEVAGYGNAQVVNLNDKDDNLRDGAEQVSINISFSSEIKREKFAYTVN